MIWLLKGERLKEGANDNLVKATEDMESAKKAEDSDDDDWDHEFECFIFLKFVFVFSV